SIAVGDASGGDGGSVRVRVIPTAISGDSGSAVAQSSATNTGNTGSAGSAANSTPLATSGPSGSTGAAGGRRAGSGDSGGTGDAGRRQRRQGRIGRRDRHPHGDLRPLGRHDGPVLGDQHRRHRLGGVDLVGQPRGAFRVVGLDR